MKAGHPPGNFRRSSTYTESAGTTVTPSLAGFSASPSTATVTLTEDISPSTAGSVQFSVNGTAIGGPVPLTNRMATTTTSFAAPGTEALSAVYTPASNSPGVTSTLTYTVSPAPASPNTIPLSVTVPSTGAFTLTVDTTDTVTLMMDGNTAMAMGAGLGNGYGTTTLGAEQTLAIPTPQAAGPYTSGLSLTSVSTTP